MVSPAGLRGALPGDGKFGSCSRLCVAPGGGPRSGGPGDGEGTGAAGGGPHRAPPGRGEAAVREAALLRLRRRRRRRFQRWRRLGGRRPGLFQPPALQSAEVSARGAGRRGAAGLAAWTARAPSRGRGSRGARGAGQALASGVGAAENGGSAQVAAHAAWHNPASPSPAVGCQLSRLTKATSEQPEFAESLSHPAGAPTPRRASRLPWSTFPSFPSPWNLERSTGLCGTRLLFVFKIASALIAHEVFSL